MARFKPITVGLSVVVIVGIVIILVIGVNKARAGARVVDLSMSKALDAFCRPTSYKQTCIDSLTPLNRDDSATPKDYLLLATKTPINAIKRDIETTEELGKSANSKAERDVFEVCRGLLGHALNELKSALSCMEDETLEDVKDRRKVELNNWLHVAVEDQEVCLGNIKNETLKEEMLNSGLRKSAELSSNILTMVSNLSKILEYLKVEKLGGRRRLLGLDFCCR